MRTCQTPKRLDRFANCGNTLWLSHDGKELQLTCNGCQDRMCQVCQRQRRAFLIKQCIDRLNAARQNCRFVTFTLRCNSLPLADQIKRLKHSMRQLRQRQWWKDRTVGGAIFIEVKIGERSGAWHVHAHCLVEGKYLDQKELSRQWLSITGDSSVVYLTAIADPEARSCYVVKYVTKPASQGVLDDPDKLDEFICSVKGQRLCLCFGTWKGFADDPPEDDKPSKGKSIDSVVSLIHRAQNHDADAIFYLREAIKKWPRLREIIPPQIHPPD